MERNLRFYFILLLTLLASSVFHLHSEKSNNSSFNTSIVFQTKGESSLDYQLQRLKFKIPSENNQDLLFVEEVNIEDFEESENHNNQHPKNSFFDKDVKNSILHKKLHQSLVSKTKQKLLLKKSNTRTLKQTLFQKFEVYRI